MRQEATDQPNSLATKAIILMVLAYIFSIAVRMIWYYHFDSNPSFFWNDVMMINTNDGYYFGTGAKDMLEGVASVNPRVPGQWSSGLVSVTTLVAQVTSIPLDRVMLYLPSIISSLVVIPVVLIAMLYKEPIWGFAAALIGAVAWSYYNRTMTGYYDTDMFSAMAPMFILYFLLKSMLDMSLKTALYASVAIVLYPFLYDQGQAIIYAIGIMYIAYMVWFYMDNEMTYKSVILVLVALIPIMLIQAPYGYILHIGILLVLYLFLKYQKISIKQGQIVSGVFFVFFLFYGDVIGLIYSKVYSYITTGTTTDGLRFYGVNQTVSEATGISFFPDGSGSNVAQRLSGSSLGFVIAIIGYLLLVFKRKEFILALPLIGIALFAHWGGLRFTVYAVPVAALGATYALFLLAQIKDRQILAYSSIALILLAIVQNYDMYHQSLGSLWDAAKHLFSFDIMHSQTMAYEQIAYIIILIMFVMWTILNASKKKSLPSPWVYAVLMSTVILLPNITHVTRYNPGTVFNNTEVKDLQKLKEISSPKDYTLSWWDYGYPIWYYSNTSTLIDGGKHDNDNFIISKILETDSSQLAAGLSRLAVETYAKTEEVVANQIFDDKNDSKDPNLVLSELEDGSYKLPPKTRDVYLFLTKKMIRIVPTIFTFGNLDLMTGDELTEYFFMNRRAIKRVGSRVFLARDISYDKSTGILDYKGNKIKLKYYITTANLKDGSIVKNARQYDASSKYSIIYAKSFGQYMIVNDATLNSMFMRMYFLGEYDKEKFELVIASPSSRIYKLKL